LSRKVDECNISSYHWRSICMKADMIMKVAMKMPTCRGLHSSTFRLNLGTFCGIVGASRGFIGFGGFRGYLGGVKGVFCVRNGLG